MSIYRRHFSVCFFIYLFLYEFLFVLVFSFVCCFFGISFSIFKKRKRQTRNISFHLSSFNKMQNSNTSAIALHYGRYCVHVHVYWVKQASFRVSVGLFNPMYVLAEAGGNFQMPGDTLQNLAESQKTWAYARRLFCERARDVSCIKSNIRKKKKKKQ